VAVADWGGDASGLDAAEVLAASGYEVALAVGSAAFGETLHAYQRNLYAARLYRAGIAVWHHLELAAWDGGGASFTNIFAPELEAVMEADALVLALGRVPVRELEIQGAVEVGDRLSPRSLEEAILEGSLAGRSLE
jgi:pyruvate/2-oxoglutarate dehydrogenase complex dihydrolipoamide dehydrogenase (E3) component